jgi:hypothetical protein
MRFKLLYLGFTWLLLTSLYRVAAFNLALPRSCFRISCTISSYLFDDARK